MRFLASRDGKSVMTCLSDLIGVKFEYGGRGSKTYDCWGLVMECHQRWHGVSLPDYRSSSSVEDNAMIMEREGKRLWKRLPEPVPGSVLLLRIKQFGGHVGFVTKPTRFLQAIEQRGVVESRFSIYHRQIIGAYEYVGH